MFLMDISTKSVSAAFAPLYWLLDESKKLDEKPTVENFKRCYQEKCAKNQKPGGLEKRLLLECLGGLGFIGGAILSLYGYVRKSKLFQVIGGALALSGVGSFITGLVKYFTLGINKIGKINNSESKKQKAPIKENKKAETIIPSSGKALIIYSAPKDGIPAIPLLLQEGFIDPSYAKQIQRILVGSISKLHEKLRKNRDFWGDPSLEAAMFIFSNPAVFVAFRAMKDFYGLGGLGNEQFVFDNDKDRQFYEDSNKARTEYYDSRFATTDPKNEYQKKIDEFNKLLGEYNAGCKSSEDRLKEVNENSIDDEVKRVYRKLARKFHPDRNPGDTEAERKFKAATEAYDLICEYHARRKNRQT